jgi:hypothetical protein
MSFKMAQAELISVGCILRLPVRGENRPCLAADCAQAKGTKKNKFCELDKNGYDHPVAVLYTKPRINEDNACELEVTFVKVLKPSASFILTLNKRLQISSLGKARVEDFINRRDNPDEQEWKTFSPICWIKSPKEPKMPGYTIRYHLEAGEMVCTSFFILPHRYTLPSHKLLNFTEGRNAKPFYTRLDEASYYLLMDRLHLKPQAFEPTVSNMKC